MSLQTLVDQATSCLSQRFNAAAKWIAVAPGRVNLIGEHVDYNDGFVLPLAIDRHVVIAASPRDDRVCRMYSLNFDASFEVALDQPIERGEPTWSNYVRGVLAGFVELGATCSGSALPGFDAVIVSDVPAGGGLSSSAALEVATATLLEAISGRTLAPVEKALLCQKAEHLFAGMPCGIMDQFASTMAQQGRLLLIDCRSLAVRHIALEHELLGADLVDDDSLVVMVIDTGVKHELTDGGYAARRSQCEEAAALLEVKSLRDATLPQLEAGRDRLTDLQWRRARHVVTEIARTLEAVQAIEDGDYATLGKLMAASHASLRDDYNVSCKELDLVVAAADRFKEKQGRSRFGGKNSAGSGGVVGCRMTGGGFGGSAVCLVRKSVVESLGSHIVAAYKAGTGKVPRLFVTAPASGTRLWH